MSPHTDQNDHQKNLQTINAGEGVEKKEPSYTVGFPGSSAVKNPLQCRKLAGDVGSIPVLRRFPGIGSGNPLQYFCLGNLMDRGAWRATAHGVSKESDTT